MVGVAALGLGLGFVRLVIIDDSPDQFFLSLLLGESTVYSKAYNEQRFRAIRVGMTESQVEAIMGPPLWKVTHPDDWFYSGRRRRASYTGREDVRANYKRRFVTFQKGRVVQIINDFWID
jgi:outer membrane protein assembly factor BamE (lipoprotein component of BamABCDE complex)